MIKLYLFLSEIFAWKKSLAGIRNYFLKKSGIKVSKNLFVDQHFAVYNPGHITFSENVSIGHFCRIWAFYPVFFGEYVQTAIGLTIVSGSHDVNDYKPLAGEMKITIEGENWIGANVLIIGGVTIGKGTIIGAGSVVVNDLPPYSICVGNPCKPIRKREPSESVLHPFGFYKPEIYE